MRTCDIILELPVGKNLHHLKELKDCILLVDVNIWLDYNIKETNEDIPNKIQSGLFFYNDPEVIQNGSYVKVVDDSKAPKRMVLWCFGSLK